MHRNAAQTQKPSHVSLIIQTRHRNIPSAVPLIAREGPFSSESAGHALVVTITHENCTRAHIFQLKTPELTLYLFPSGDALQILRSWSTLLQRLHTRLYRVPLVCKGPMPTKRLVL